VDITPRMAAKFIQVLRRHRPSVKVSAVRRQDSFTNSRFLTISFHFSHLYSIHRDVGCSRSAWLHTKPTPSWVGSARRG
jgi:hypothetical protein